MISHERAFIHTMREFSLQLAFHSLDHVKKKKERNLNVVFKVIFNKTPIDSPSLPMSLAPGLSHVTGR